MPIDLHHHADHQTLGLAYAPTNPRDFSTLALRLGEMLRHQSRPGRAQGERRFQADEANRRKGRQELIAHACQRSQLVRSASASSGSHV